MILPETFSQVLQVTMFLLILIASISLVLCQVCIWNPNANMVHTHPATTYLGHHFLIDKELITLSDLRTAVPFTWDYTLGVEDCSNTYLEWRTALFSEATYPALVASAALPASGTVTIRYTFPNLLLTMLKPGDTIIMVQHQLQGQTMIYACNCRPIFISPSIQTNP